MELKVYRLQANAFKAIRKQHLLKTVPVVLLAGATGLFIAHKTSNTADFSTFYLAAPLALVAVLAGLNRGLNRQKELLESYVLTIDENSIRREQLNTETIHIYKREVKEINADKSGAISIRTSDRTECIAVPAQIQDRDELIHTLSQIVPFSPNKSILERHVGVFTIGVLGLMAAVFLVQEKWIVVATGSLLAFILTWCMYEVYRSKGIDSKTKRGMLYLVVVLAAVVYKVVSVLWN